MIYVVGSGPSGIAAAEALARAGLEVTIVDGGVELEMERRAAVERLRKTPRGEWHPAMVSFLFDSLKLDRRGIQEKRVFGSNFPYYDTPGHIPVRKTDVGSMSPSLAVGGFSSVWGAAVLPYSARDLTRWPIGLDALAPHYREILRYMPLAGIQDDLDPRFPLYTGEARALDSSSQAESLLDRMTIHRSELAQEGLSFGRSRLAVRGGESGCVRCGFCMHGCPYGFIYSTQSTLDDLAKLPNVRHMPGTIITRVEERHGRTVLHGYRRATREAVELEGDAVFLGAGVLSSAAIMMRSLGVEGIELELPVSEYFLLPLVSRRAFPGIGSESIHTLAQLFLECDDPSLSPHTIHMQLYGYSDLYQRALRSMVGGLPIFDRVSERLSARMFVIQGYLHSDDSSTIRLRLDGSGKLVMRANRSARAQEVIRNTVRKLRRISGFTGLHTVPGMLRIGLPGEGRHVGGALPMARDPGARETDLLGRPSGFERTFVVDATTFPTVAAPTITFTAMANARRIATGYLESGR